MPANLGASEPDQGPTGVTDEQMAPLPAKVPARSRLNRRKVIGSPPQPKQPGTRRSGMQRRAGPHHADERTAWFLATRLNQDGMSAVLMELIDESRISGSGFPSKRERQRTDSWSRSGEGTCGS